MTHTLTHTHTYKYKEKESPSQYSGIQKAYLCSNAWMALWLHLMLCAWTTAWKKRNHWITRSFDYQVGETIKCKVCACFLI